MVRTRCDKRFRSSGPQRLHHERRSEPHASKERLRARLFRIVPALFREVRLPRFTCPLAVLRASVRAARLLRQGPLEPLGAPAQRPVDLYRAPFSDTPGVLSIHAREPMVSFLNVMRPTAPL